jgi:hypothetical protein
MKYFDFWFVIHVKRNEWHCFIIYVIEAYCKRDRWEAIDVWLQLVADGLRYYFFVASYDRRKGEVLEVER